MSGFRVIPFRREHMLAVRPVAWRAVSLAEQARMADAYHAAGNAFSVVQGDTVLMCGGAVDAHPGYASLWSIYADHASRKQWAYMLRRARHFIADLPHRRVDAAIAKSDKAAVHWAFACGLRPEATMHGAAQDGGDMVLMARVKAP